MMISYGGGSSGKQHGVGTRRNPLKMREGAWERGGRGKQGKHGWAKAFLERLWNRSLSGKEPSHSDLGEETSRQGLQPVRRP